jgi:hypothetical protein
LPFLAPFFLLKKFILKKLKQLSTAGIIPQVFSARHQKQKTLDDFKKNDRNYKLGFTIK